MDRVIFGNSPVRMAGWAVTRTVASGTVTEMPSGKAARMEHCKRRRGPQARLRHEVGAQPPVDAQSLAVPTRTMQRHHEPAVRTLVHPLLVDRHRQVRQQPTVAAQMQIGIDAPSQRAQAGLPNLRTSMSVRLPAPARRPVSAGPLRSPRRP
ncbi:hypothetical protein OG496_53755 [Streptomyces sp. NBC_00988]|nr:hypothetical protein OG496_53755 [Streptomyces sp. NBC_00988]